MSVILFASALFVFVSFSSEYAPLFMQADLTTFACHFRRMDAGSLASAAGAALSGVTSSQLLALAAADPQASALAMPLLAGVQTDQAQMQQLQQLHAALLSAVQLHGQILAQQAAAEQGGTGGLKQDGAGGIGGGEDGGISGVTHGTNAGEGDTKAGGTETSKSKRSYKCSVRGQPKR